MSRHQARLAGTTVAIRTTPQIVLAAVTALQPSRHSTAAGIFHRVPGLSGWGVVAVEPCEKLSDEPGAEQFERVEKPLGHHGWLGS